ncbi:MAG TPA: patatin-like phospholipase family protein [Methylomirabilota bacterium]
MIQRMSRSRRGRWMVALALLLGGCFAQVKDLPPLTVKPPFAPVPETAPDLLVGVAISGGGSRAAIFAAAVLEALARTPVKDAGGQRSVLERVQYISSVSGGSLATGYFAARKPGRAEPMLTAQGLSPAYERFFKEYRAAMQENFEAAAIWRQLLLFRAFNPTKAAYSLAEVWDERFLHGMTFTQLYERERAGDSPRIIFNGTSYNSGRRFALTTLPAADFDYDFVAGLLEDLIRRSDRVTAEGKAIIRANLEQARSQFLPLTFEQIGADHRELPISLAMVSSASFPPAVGPVTYAIDGRPPYEHVGDGGLFDNLGTESLATFFLKKIPRDSPRRGLIIVVDAAFPFDANQAFLDGNRRGYQVFRNDPSRIVGIMEERANAYQLMLWDALRTEGIVLPDFANLRVEVLRHTEPDWGVYKDLPEACRSDFGLDVTAKAIKEAVSQIPTRFQVSPCNAALMSQAAQKVVDLHRRRIVEFLERSR